MRHSPPQIRTAMLNYITMAQHHQKTRLESTGMLLNHTPHLGACLARQFVKDGASAFSTARPPRAKPPRPTVGIDPQAPAIPKAPAVRTGCVHGERPKCRRVGPEMTTSGQSNCDVSDR